MSLVIGLAGVLALDTFLTARLDDQLTAAVDRSARGLDDDAVRPQAGPPADRRVGPLQVPGQAEGTLGALVDDGTVISSRIVERSGELTTVPAESAALLADVPIDGHPHTVELGDDLGNYRVVASAVRGGATFVTGLPLSMVDGPVSQLAGVVVAVGLAGLLVAGVAGALIIGHALRPLRRVASTATRVAEMPLDRGEVALAVRVPAVDTDPRTEVGRVGAALNHLLENVATALTARQASETRVRQFVADASHELRTPLAAIRGYAELTRRRRNPVPEDVAHALNRVESEAVRMTGLVDDLLLLARLDAGRPVESSPVDLSAVVIDAVGDAHVAGPKHRWALDLPDSPVVVTGDRARLHQIVANLLANARVHTPPDTTVRIHLSAQGPGDGRPETATLSVIDDGPGIPADLRPTVFDRFARGDSSRSHAAGSTGLGLAIVAAVVVAHDGDVSVDSRPGFTAFTVRLPMAAPATASPHASSALLTTSDPKS
ncbi:MAG TPA: HAMP domain-containing sensor histidine kinase [Jiangellaceae bacterium]|nr:HAMP domain-containing sensor histidine kinase [Jiangellaceae bacterium]